MIKKYVVIKQNVSGSYDNNSLISSKEVLPHNEFLDKKNQLNKFTIIKKRGRKPKNKIYFSESTEEAIVRYNQSDSNVEKNKIFVEEIYYPFDKLSENIINTFKFIYFNDHFNDVKAEVVFYLLLNIHKYKQEKGKAFSYFSIIAKNHLIKLNNENYSKMKITQSIDNVFDDESIELDIMDDTDNKNLNDFETNEFVHLMIVYWEENIRIIFKKSCDIDIAYAIIELFKKKDNLDVFNKKALYLCIREMTGYKTSSITKVLNTMSNYYKKIKNTYYEYGVLDDNSYLY